MLPPAVTQVVSTPIVSWYLGLVGMYLSGLVTAPFLKLLVRPVLKGAVKTTVQVAWEVKRLAAEAAEEVYEISAEAFAEFEHANDDAQSDMPGPQTSLSLPAPPSHLGLRYSPGPPKPVG